MSRIAQALTNLFDLIGDMGGGYRERHIKPELLLVYRKSMERACDWLVLSLIVNYFGESFLFYRITFVSDPSSSPQK